MPLFTNFQKILYLSIVTILFSSCRDKYIWFTGLQAGHNASSDNVLRVYFDRYSDLYPSDKIYIHPDEFLPGKPNDKLNHARLETYFTAHPDYLKELAGVYQYELTGKPKDDFDALQLKIMAEYRLQFQHFSQLHPTKKLVVFIHGFNDPDPTGNFQELRNAIHTEHFDKNHEFIYIEVYWDGLTANGGSPGFAGIWGKAQFDSRYVCLGLRKLLNQIAVPNTLPMTVITHSLGASVATGALFNTHSKWKENEDSFTAKEIKQLEKEATPKMPVRLGMLAPAIPGVATFVDILDRETKIPASQNNINRIVISINPNDYALDKGTFRKSQFLAPIAGATTLGSDYHHESDKVRTCLAQQLGNTFTDAQYQVIIFNTKWMPKPDQQFQEHGLHYYLQDKAAMHSFIQALFQQP